MRLFKHGDSLAVVIPEKARKSLGLTEATELEVIELEKGTLVLIDKSVLEEKTRQGVLAKLYPAQSAASVGPVSSSTSSYSPQSSGARPVSVPFDPLNGKSYLIIETEAEIKRLAPLMQQSVKKGEIVGTQGPDKKYYVAKTEFYSVVSGKVTAALEKETTLADIAKKTNLDPKLVQLAIFIMKEQGDVLERKKGMFSLVK